LSSIAIPATLLVLAHERVEARDAFLDRLGRRRVREPDVLAVARNLNLPAKQMPWDLVTGQV